MFNWGDVQSVLCKQLSSLLERLGENVCVSTIDENAFRRVISNSEEETRAIDNGDFNFDHPGLFQHLHERLSADVVEHELLAAAVIRRCLDESRLNVLLVKGMHVLGRPELLALFNLKVFVDVDADLRLARRGPPIFLFLLRLSSLQ